jgi:hypothetical protein
MMMMNRWWWWIDGDEAYIQNLTKNCVEHVTKFCKAMWLWKHFVKAMWKQMECKCESRIIQCEMVNPNNGYRTWAFGNHSMRAVVLENIVDQYHFVQIACILARISEFFRPCDPKNCLIQYVSRGLPVFVFQWLGALDKVVHFANIKMEIKIHWTKNKFDVRVELKGWNRQICNKICMENKDM